MVSFRVGRIELVACVLLLSLAVACGKGDGNGKNDSSTPTIAAPDLTPEAAAIVDGQSFVSVASGYGVEFPDGWQWDDNFLFTSETVTDVFFAPAPAQGAQGSVQIRCDRDLGEFTGPQFIEDRKQVAQAFALQDVTEDTIQVGTETAARLRYQQRPSDITVQKTDIVFFAHGCGWTITLTEGLDQDYSADFDKMLSTFRFV